MDADAPYRSPAMPRPGSMWSYNERETLALRGRSFGVGRTVVWTGYGLFVISSKVNALYHDELCEQNVVSVSLRKVAGRRYVGQRPTDADMRRVRTDFDMADAEEDNHESGMARKLFLPLHLPRGTTGNCDCKDDETQVVEADGFTYSKTKGGT